MNLESQIHRISCFPYRHFEHSEKSSLHSALSCSLRRRIPPSLLSHIWRYTGVQERALHFGRDDDTGIAFSKHIRCTLREINPFSPTVISSVARNGNTGRTFSQRTLYTIQRISIPYTVISSAARNLFRPLFPRLLR